MPMRTKTVNAIYLGDFGDMSQGFPDGNTIREQVAGAYNTQGTGAVTVRELEFRGNESFEDANLFDNDFYVNRDALGHGIAEVSGNFQQLTYAHQNTLVTFTTTTGSFTANMNFFQLDDGSVYMMANPQESPTSSFRFENAAAGQQITGFSVPLLDTSDNGFPPNEGDWAGTAFPAPDVGPDLNPDPGTVINDIGAFYLGNDFSNISGLTNQEFSSDGSVGRVVTDAGFIYQARLFIDLPNIPVNVYDKERQEFENVDTWVSHDVAGGSNAPNQEQEPLQVERVVVTFTTPEGDIPANMWVMRLEDGTSFMVPDYPSTGGFADYEETVKGKEILSFTIGTVTGNSSEAMTPPLDPWTGGAFPEPAPNEAPIANDDNRTIDYDFYERDANGTIGIRNVLRNDTDPDGDSLSVVSAGGDTTPNGMGWFDFVDASNGGQIRVNVDGRSQFRGGDVFADLPQGQSVTTSIEYTVADASGATSTATLSLTIRGTAEAPTGPTTITITPAPGTQLDDEGRPLTGENGAPAQIVVSLDAPALEDTVITLTNGDASEINPPLTVTIPAGQSSVIVDVPSVDDTDVDGTQIATVTASAPGLTGASIEVAVEDDDVAANQIVDGENTGEVMNPEYNDNNAPTDSGGDIIDGIDGVNDVILGNGGDDVINAGVGADEVYGGSGNDVIEGGAGNDVITGDFADGVSDVVVDSGTAPGDDTLRGGDGNDIIYGDSNTSGEIGIRTFDFADGRNQDLGDTTVRVQTTGDVGNGDGRTPFNVNITQLPPEWSTGETWSDGSFRVDNFGIRDDFGRVIDGTSTYIWTYSEPVQGFSMVVSQIDDGDNVGIFARGPDGQPVQLFFTAGSSLTPIGSGTGVSVVSTSNGTAIGNLDTTLTVWANEPVSRIDFGLSGQHEVYIAGPSFGPAVGYVPLDGEGGNDIIEGGLGADQMFGEGGDDTFLVGSAEEGAGDVIVGGNGPDQTTDFDVLDLRGSGAVTIDSAADTNDDGALAGTVTFNDGSTLEFSQIEQILQDVAPTTISIAPAPGTPVDDEGRPLTIENGAPAQIVVSLDAPALEDTVITLTNGDASEINPPLTVTIPAGQSSVIVDVPSVDDTDVDGTQIATVTASAPGLTGASIEVAVEDDDVPELSITAAPGTPVDDAGNPVTSENGDPVELVITRTGPTDQPLVITLSSDDATEGAVPATVTIPAGETSVTFAVTPVDDTEVDGTQFPTITATADGFTPVTETVAVEDDDVAPTTISITPAPGTPVDDEGRPLTVENGAPAQIVVALDAPALVDTVITLANGDASEINPPLTVTIPAGQSSVIVDVPSVDDTDVDGTQIAVVAATAPGLTGATIEVAVEDDDFASNQIVDGENTGEIMNPEYNDNNAPTDSGGDTIDGADGVNDVILGNGGDDVINAGLGADKVYGGSGNDVIEGGAGNDVITGDFADGVSDVVVDSGTAPGDDTLRGGDGNDIIYGDSNTPGEIGTRTFDFNAGNTQTFGGVTASWQPDDVGGDDGVSFPVYIGELPDSYTGGANRSENAWRSSLDNNGTGAQSHRWDFGGQDVEGFAVVIGGFQPGERVNIVGINAAGEGVSATVVVGSALTLSESSGSSFGVTNSTPFGAGFQDPATTFTYMANEPLTYVVITHYGDNSVWISPGYFGAGVDEVPTDGIGGDDVIEGGLGADQMFGEGGDDTFLVGSAEEGAGDVIVGGNGPDQTTDFDVLDLRGSGAVTIDSATDTTDDGALAGTVTFNDGSTLEFSQIEQILQDVPPTTISITPAPGTPVDDEGRPLTVENGAPAQIVVSLDAPALEDTVITLTNGDASEINPPLTVTIPAGQSSVIVDVPSVDDTDVDGTQIATVTASAPGLTGATIEVAVEDDDVPELSITAAPGTPVDDAGNPVTSENGDPVELVITRTGPTDQPLVITLSSDDATEGAVPATVTIPAGETSVTFAVTPVDDTEVDGTQFPTITATADGFTPVTETVAVEDDDVAPTTISITPAPNTPVDDEGRPLTVENGAPAQIVVALDAPALVDTVITLTNGDASEINPPLTVTIPAGQSSVIVDVPSVDDTDVDGTQIATVTASAPGLTGATIEVAVEDDDVPELSITAAPGTPVDDAGNPVTSENGDPVELVITRTGPTDQPLVITLSSDDATEGAVPATVTIPAGETSVTFAVTPVDDTEVDGTQFPTITATADGFTPVTETVAVEDDDVAPTTISITPAPGTPVDDEGRPLTVENGAPAQIVVALDAPALVDTVVTLTNGDASEINPPLTVTIPAGQSSVIVDVPSVDDTDVDGTQIAVVTASAPGLTGATIEVAVEDDDVPELSITAAPGTPVDDAGNPVTSENGDPVELVITRTGPTDQPLVITLSSDDATEGAVPATVTIPAGETSVTFAVTPVDDTEVDGTQFPTITATADGFTPVTETVAVEDDDVAPTTISITPAPNTPVDDEGRPLTIENGAPAQIVVALDAPALVDTVVTLINGDASEINPPLTVTIPAGQSSVIVDVPSVDDTDVDGTQIATVTASAPGLTGATIEVAVADDDVPVLSITAAPGTPVDDAGNPVTSENGDPVELVITRTGPTDQPLVITLSSDDATEGAVPATVTIPAGETSVTFAVTPVDDTEVDGTQFPTITATADGFTPVTETVAVEDDDVAPTTISITPAPGTPVDDEGRPLTVENGAPAQIVVALDAPALVDTVVTLTNGDASEINPPLTVTIPAGQSSVIVDVPSVDDTDVDGTQIAVVTASAPGLTGATIEVAVEDDDVPELSITAAPGTPVDDAGNPVTSENGDPVELVITRTGPTDQPLVITLSSDDATEGAVPTTVTIPAGETSVTFAVTPVDDTEVDGTQFPTITATADGFTPVTETVAVEDDDVAPTTISITPAPGTPVDDEGRPLTVENGAPAQIVVALDAPALVDTVVTLTNGDASEINPPLTVTIPAGQSSVIVDVPSVDDTDVDGTQIAVVAATAPGLIGATIEVAVEDDDVPELSITAAPGTPVDDAGNPVTSENGDPVELVITRTGPTDQPLVITLSSDDATEGAVPATVTIPAGETSVTFAVTPVDDTEVDGTQFPTITATADGFTPVTETVAVEDDDVAPTTISITPAPGTPVDDEGRPLTVENGAPAQIVVALDAPALVDTVITLTNGDASEINPPLTVTIPAGQSSVIVDVPSVDDTDVDGTQIATVTASAPGLTGATIEVAVEDDDVPELSITAAPGTPVDDAGNPVTSENGDPVELVITRTGPTDQPLVITLSSDDATEGAVPATVTIPAGETSVTFAVTPVDDTEVDGTQFPTITATADGFTPVTETVAVEDDDVAPTTISITPAPNTPVDDEGRPLTVENGAPAQIVVALDAPALVDTVITLANGDASEINPPLTVTIPAGQSSVIVDVPSVDDTDVDGTQIAVVVATAPGLTGATIEVAVADDDVPVLSITAAPGTPVDDAGNPVTSENGDPVELVITRTGPTDQPLVITLSSDDATEGAVPTTVTIPAGETSVTFAVTPVDDTEVDGTQFPTITATADGFTPVTETVAVEDDDVAPTAISITPAPGTPVDDEGRPLTVENGAPAQIVVALDAPALVDTVVTLINGDASEINPPLTVTIPAGQSSVIVDVPSVDDTDVDGTQIVTVTAFTMGLTPATIEVAVEDDDVPELSITAAPGTPVDDAGNPVTSENGDPVELVITRTGPTDQPLVITLSSDDATEGAVPATVTIPAGETSVTFAVTPVDDTEVDGTQFPTITATADGFTPVTETVAVEDDDVAPTTISITPAPNTPVDDEGRPLTIENGAPAQIVVALDAPALVDTVVTLINGDASEINPPLTVTIPAGQSSVIVDVPSVDDTDVDGTQIATVTAFAFGLTPASIEVAVADDDVPVLSITAAPGTPVDDAGNPVTSENGDPVELVITRTGPTDQPLVITLSSDDATEGAVPTTVTIPAGETSVTFAVTPVDDTEVDGTQFPTITATADGFTPVTETVAVEDDDVAPTAISITPAPGTPVDDEGRPLTVENGAPAQIVVALDAPALVDTVVTLINGDASEINPPLTVTIPAGQSSVIVDVPSVDDTEVDGTQIATVTAFAFGLTPASIEVAVADDDVPVLSITAAPGTPVDDAGNPVTSENGDPVELVITRTGPTDQPLVITLSSDDATEGAVPATVTIPAGETSVTFAVTPVDDTEVDGTQFPTITATADGFAPVTETVAVEDDDVAPTAISITPAPGTPVDDEGRPLTVENGAPAQIVVALDAPALVDTVITLINGDASEINPPLTVTIPAGQSSVIVDVPSVDDTEVDGTQIATVTAFAFGLTPASIEVAVADDDSAPVAVDDQAETVYDEAILVDVLDNDSDADNDVLTITKVNGMDIIEGGPAINVDGVFVSLVGGELLVDGSSAFADLIAGETGTTTFSYTIDDGNGGTATADAVVTFKGETDTLIKVDTLLPDDEITIQVIFEEFNVGNGVGLGSFTLKLDGDADLDGVYTNAYCLDIFASVLPGGFGTNIDDAFMSGAVASIADKDFIDVEQQDFAGTGINGELAIDNLDLINWIMNQDFESVDNGDGAGQTYTGSEIQGAIWALTNGQELDGFGISGGIFVGSNFGTADNAQEILDLALANGEGFEPGDGDLVGVFVDPTTSPFNQPFIVTVDLYEDHTGG